MTSKPENPAAFPRPSFQTNHGDIEWGNWGMTLLDYFAGQALAGYMADPDIPSFEKVAEACYDLAEKMLIEREKRNARD